MPVPDLRWEIRGADRDTGRELTIIAEGADQQQAERQAMRQGMLVASVKPLLDGPIRHNVAVDVPEYAGIAFGVVVLNVLAAIYLAAAVLVAIAWIFSSKESPSMEPISFASLTLELHLTTILGLVLISAVLFLAAGVADAVRDIARNSFRNRS